MRQNKRFKFGLVFIAAALLLIGGTAFADKPSWAGGGGKHQSRGQSRGHEYDAPHARRYYGEKPHYPPSYRRDFGAGEYFHDQQRLAVRDYYSGQFRAGHCPPGLAKKHNGCLPPGQARSWTIGHPLPPDVVYYPLPPAVAMGIGPPPAGYRFVRVASDILMIATGTGMVIDAIRDLGGM
jgi:hypothetical protein